MGSSSSKSLFLYFEMISSEPLSNMLSLLIEDGVGLFIEEDPVRDARRLRSRDLKSVQFLGQGLSGFIYETTWSTWSTWFGKRKLGRFARKDFPGVESEVFECETARLINLNHPNLVKAFGWTVDRLGCSLVLEFVSNDLQSVVEMRREASMDLEPPFQIAEAIYIMLHLARAMEFLHLNGVSHGDLRPNNVLVDLEADPMIVKVVDFGLTKSKQRTTLVSQRARFLETFDWRAPETSPCSFDYTLDEFDWEELDFVQATTPADEPSDVYSFAITCAYIMGGRLPFSEKPEKVRGTSAGIVRPEIPSSCPALLRESLRLSWDSDPKRRPPFSKLREKLEILQQQETTRGEAKFSGVMQPMKTKRKRCGGVRETQKPLGTFDTAEEAL